MENFDKLKEILVDVLGVKEEEIKLQCFAFQARTNPRSRDYSFLSGYRH